MKHTIEKRFSRTILATSIAAIGFSVPLAAQAEDDLRSLTTPDSQIEVGVGNISDGSYKYGDYGRGLEQSGAYLIGNVHMNTRGDNNASYLEIIARNLGLSGSRDFAIRGGEQGNYGLSFEYDELSKLHSDSFMTPYTGMGSTVLTGPATWTIAPAPGATTNIITSMMTDLAANMKRFNVETQRKAAAFGVTKQLDGGWDLAVNFKREEKDGTRLTGAPVQAKNPATRKTLLAPEPIDYTTDLFDVLARYADEKLQMQLGYHASLFDNANRSLTFDNLYQNPVSSLGADNATGRLGLMPANQFHRIRVSGGYTLSEETRLSGNLNLGRMTQNEAFLPYDTTTNTMPATASLNGRIDTTHADIKLNSKLTHELDLTAGYKYDDRDNRTAVNTYTYFTADNTTSNTLLRNERRNTPLSKKWQALYADLDFELSEATKLKLGYDFDKIAHTYEPTSGDKEHTVKAEVKHSFGDTASGGLAYAHSDRKASSAYDGAAGLLDTYTAAYLAEHLAASQCAVGSTFVNSIGATVTCIGNGAAGATTFAWLEPPALRKYFLADRKRDKLRAFADVAASEKLDLQFGASYYKERYPDAETGFGLTRATGWTANFDANLAATEAVSGVFFASFEDYSTGMNSHQYAAETYTLIRELNNAAFDAYTGTISRVERSLTVGLGLKVKQDDNFDWGGEFTHAATIGSTGFSNLGSKVTGIFAVPDEVSRLSRLELFGKYKVQKDVTLNVKYVYEQFNSTDWQWDNGVQADYQITGGKKNFITTGQASPDYRVHAIGASLAYSF